jgi:iron complex transport system substrate-binding protein
VLSNWYVGTHWQENTKFISNVLGKEAMAEEAWNHYYGRARELRSLLAEKYQGKEISVVDIYGSAIYPHTRNSFSGTILSDLQLQRPAAQDVVAEFGYITVSKEELQQIDGDILFIMIGNSDDEKFLENLKRQPLWRQLRAAQTDRIYVVRNYIWWGGNLLAANLVLNDLEKYLINTP